MNTHELDSYRLSDAVKFNNELNPRIWGPDEQMLPAVRDRLLEIAADFKEFLGVTDFELRDITVSGSNAAYTYTPHSDIDLHLVVDLPRADQSDVYRELFDAKKFQYNTQHNIKIGGYDVELYVQNANKSVVSQGEYSVLNNDWLQVPRRVKSSVNDAGVKSKYHQMKAHIESAVASSDADVMSALAKKISTLRQTSLDKYGEFGPENLAYKMLRTQGLIQKLYDARNAARDQELSLDELAKPKTTKKKIRYGYSSYWFPGTAYAGQDHPAGTETVQESTNSLSLSDTLDDFAASCVEFLKIKQIPVLKLRRDPEWSKRSGSFGQYDSETNTLELATHGRHVLDILRTMAHEMTHRRQDEQNPLPFDAGATGSPWEDQANAMAGRMMRHWAEKHPEMFANISLDSDCCVVLILNDNII